MMYDWHDTGWGPGMWIAMGLMMLAFWGLIAVLVVYVVRNLGHRPPDHSGTSAAPPDQALRILDERFAHGDIDADEYNQRRDVLRSR